VVTQIAKTNVIRFQSDTVRIIANLGSLIRFPLFSRQFALALLMDYSLQLQRSHVRWEYADNVLFAEFNMSRFFKDDLEFHLP